MRLFVDKEVQSALALRIAIHWFVLVSVTFVLIGFLRSVVQTPTLEPTVLLKTFLMENSISLIVSFSLLPIFVYDLIRVSNRFAGPMYRLRVTLADMAQGKPVRPISFRDGDFWEKVAADFNKASNLSIEFENAS